MFAGRRCNVNKVNVRKCDFRVVKYCGIQGAPQILIVSSSNDEGSAFADKLGYGDCKASNIGLRELSVCKVPTQVSVAHE